MYYQDSDSYDDYSYCGSDNTDDDDSQDVEDSIFDIANALTPKKYQVKAYKAVLNNVVQVLHNSPYRIGRICTGGSFAKDTGVPYNMDLDITFFLNDEEPPFYECLKEITDLIEAELDVENLTTTKHSIFFDITHDDLDEPLRVDLLPAPNYVTHTNGIDIAEEQHRLTVEEIRSWNNAFKASRCLSNSFTEASVAFMKSVSEDIHQLVRLAKFWKDSVYFDGYVPGLSSTIEIIAVYAGIEYSRSCSDDFSTLEAFRGFLSTMQAIGDARIIFSHEEMDEKECRTFYSTDEILGCVLNQEPLVMDPVDPFDNRLHNKNSKRLFIDILAEKATQTLEEIDYVMDTSEDLTFDLLVALCPGPFDSCLSCDAPEVIEVPEDMAITKLRAPKITESQIKERGEILEHEEEWADFLLQFCERIVGVAQELDIDCFKMLKTTFETGTKKKFRKIRHIPDYYHHTLRIPIGGDYVANIFLRWQKNE